MCLTRFLFVAAALTAGVGCAKKDEPAALAEAMVVHAASSLTNVLPEVAAAWKAAGGGPVRFAFEASSRLARQIAAGAPGDVFISADLDWMDDVEKRGLLAPGTRRRLLSNRMVVVVPADRTAPLPDFHALASVTRLALAGEGVPAGRYARAALRKQGVWAGLEARVVNGDNVRTTLAWVARGEADAALVYETDARVEQKVRVAFSVPEDNHDPIVYPAAVLKSSTSPSAGSAFLDFCQSEAGWKIFAAAGFVRPTVE